jgi:hypothetical protein
MKLWIYVVKAFFLLFFALQFSPGLAMALIAMALRLFPAFQPFQSKRLLWR